MLKLLEVEERPRTRGGPTLLSVLTLVTGVESPSYADPCARTVRRVDFAVPLVPLLADLAHNALICGRSSGTVSVHLELRFMVVPQSAHS